MERKAIRAEAQALEVFDVLISGAAIAEALPA